MQPFVETDQMQDGCEIGNKWQKLCGICAGVMGSSPHIQIEAIV
jgi:hypothetical protein